MVLVNVRDRAAFRDWLRFSMPGSSQHYDVTSEHRPGEGRAKAYLLDVHTPEGQSPHDALATIFTEAAELCDAQVQETQDAQFFRLTHKGEVLFLDGLSPRFVVAHTTGHARATDALIQKIVDTSAHIDRAWLASPFLEEQVPLLGKVFRRAVQFDSLTFWSGKSKSKDHFWEDDDQEEENPSKTLGQQVSLDFRGGSLDADAIADLQQLPRWKGTLALARMDAYRLFEDEEEYLVERVYKWGKISGVGTTAEYHLDFVNRLRTQYERSLAYIESNFRMSSEEDHGAAVLHGHPISIEYDLPAEYLDLFVRRVFSGKKPFRLWGVPQRRNSTYFTVQALDMHVSQSIYCEVTDKGMRLYLKSNSCGNTIARLYTNLLSYFNAQARIWGRGPNDILLRSY